MAARRSGFTRRGQVRSRRQSSWNVGPGGVSAQAVSSVTSLILGGAIEPTSGGLTLVRTRGILELVLNTTSAIGSGFHGASGIAIVSSDAFAAGAGSIPNPISDVSWDGWLWHQFFDIHSVTATIADGANAASVYRRIEVDSKAMRKFGLNDAMVWMLETAAEVGTAAMNVHADSRILIKLP